MQIAENEGEPETNYSLVSRQVRGGSKHYLPHTRPKWCTQLYHVKFCLGNLGICLSEWQTVKDDKILQRRELSKNLHILFQRCLHY